MNSKFINSSFVSAHLVSYPSMIEWKKLEFFVLGDFIIKERKEKDGKYSSILRSLALSEFKCSELQSKELVDNYVLLITRERHDLEAFTNKYYRKAPLVAGVEIFNDYGVEGIRVLAERKFIKRSTAVLEKLFILHRANGFIGNDSLRDRFAILGENAKYAEMGLLLLKRRGYFGQPVIRELGFFLWFLNLALDPEDYAVKYVSSKSIEDLERTYGAYLKKLGGLHQTMVKLTREVKAGMRRFE